MAKKINYITGVGSRLDSLQTGLDIIGMTEIPLVSQGADVISGTISLARGDYIGAALSAGSLIPGVGQATGAAKIALRAKKIADTTKTVNKTSKNSADLLSITKYKTAEYLKKNKKPSKPAETNAKSAKTENVQEYENTEIQQNNNTEGPTLGQKLDINFGQNTFAKTDLEKEISTDIQKANYEKFIQTTENGKQYDNFYRNGTVLKKYYPF